MKASELIVFPWRAQSHQEPTDLQHPYGEGRQIDIDTQRGFVICSILGADGGIPLPVININKERCSKHEVIRIKMVWNSKCM